jgi:hypothetical protein
MTALDATLAGLRAEAARRCGLAAYPAHRIRLAEWCHRPEKDVVPAWLRDAAAREAALDPPRNRRAAS